jgi:site-specific recombinase XerD
MIESNLRAPMLNRSSQQQHGEREKTLYRYASKHSHIPSKPQRLLDQVRSILRVKHYSYRTERSYVRWMVTFIRFHKLRHPKELKENEIREFLTHLATKEKVSASTQNQALNALVFLYKQVLEIDLGDLSYFLRAKKRTFIPTVLTVNEVTQIIAKLSGTAHIMLALLYGTGLRLSEFLNLRVKDVDFQRNQIVIRDCKGDHDRVVMLPR